MKETAKALEAYADYVALGSKRSLEKLITLYQTRPEGGPTRQLSQLKKWSTAHDWQGKIAALADEQRQRNEDEILTSGYALVADRVQVLKELAETLIAELRGDRLWLRERKSIKVGSTAVFSDDGSRVIGQEPQYEVFDLERPNAAWVEHVRGLLDDIAKETGGRVTKTELSGKGGGPIIIERTEFAGDDDE